MLHVKKHIFTLLLMWLAVGLSAAPITREQARQKAVEFLKNARGSKQLAPVQNKTKLSPRRLAPKAQRELYYVFNRGYNEGYVIVSGDDKTLSVLGYTEEGEFDYNNLPDNMRYWLQGYEQQLLYLSEHPESMTETPRYAPTHDRVEPMVKSKWNQGDPYNRSCPTDTDGRRSVTGCVATAMAQILYYNREKMVTETQAQIPAYEKWSHKVKVAAIPEGSPIDWDNMADNGGSNDVQRKAVADLMLYCGASVKMDYTSSSSGAQVSDVFQAFKTYFGLGSTLVYHNGLSSDIDDVEWDRIVYQDLAAGNVVLVSGYTADWQGHAFVADGYDGNRHYHINWGWGGSSDGYYLLTNLTPGQQGIGGSDDGSGFSTGLQIITGIEPVNYATRQMNFSDQTVRRLCLNNWDSDGDGKLTYGEAAAVTDLGEVFSGQRIQQFPELYYFTGLSTIGDGAFSGCQQLTTLRLPKGLKRIGSRAFAGCSRLTKIELPSALTAIVLRPNCPA